MRTFFRTNKYARLWRFKTRHVLPALTQVLLFVVACCLYGVALGTVTYLADGNAEASIQTFYGTVVLGLVGTPMLMALVHLSTRNLRPAYA